MWRLWTQLRAVFNKKRKKWRRRLLTHSLCITVCVWQLHLGDVRRLLVRHGFTHADTHRKTHTSSSMLFHSCAPAITERGKKRGEGEMRGGWGGNGEVENWWQQRAEGERGFISSSSENTLCFSALHAQRCHQNYSFPKNPVLLKNTKLDGEKIFKNQAKCLGNKVINAEKLQML